MLQFNWLHSWRIINYIGDFYENDNKQLGKLLIKIVVFT